MALSKQVCPAPAQELVEKTNLKHVAIIMDGNRRWAKKHKLPSTSGHNAGVKAFKNIVKLSAKWGIKYLTVYAFSTENWQRKKEEVDYLMLLLGETIKKELKSLHKNNIKLTIIGNLDALNPKLKKMLLDSMETTQNNTGLNLQVGINYGSRDEITAAVKHIAKDIQNNKINVDDIDSALISDYLYTSNVPDPDLLIRTGGEYRLSNYLLWQAAYSEIYVTKVYWPDFSDKEYEKAISEFAGRSRRFGRD